MLWIILVSLVGLFCAFNIHYDGYKRGREHGIEIGKEKINEYALKINEAQGERIKELMNEKNAEI